MSILSGIIESEEDIKISWEDYPEIHLGERMTKGEYLKLIKEICDSSFSIISSIRNSYKDFLQGSKNRFTFFLER